MTVFAVCLFVLLVFSSFSLSEGKEVKIIENPAKPVSEKAGRVVGLKEVFRITDASITDASGEFYFKNPSRLKVAPDGAFFLVDKEEFLHFDAKGNFIANRFKKGQGPGECDRILDYHFRDNKIYIYTGRPHKILVTDLKGNLAGEYRADHRMRFLKIFGMFADKYWFAGTNDESFYKKNAGEINLNLELSYVTAAGKIEKTGLLIPEKWYIVKKESNKGSYAIGLNRVITTRFAMDPSGILFFMNSQKYLVQRLDFGKGKITGKFRREYSGILFKDKKSEDGKVIPRLPRPDYFTDIQHLFLNKDEIWVFTSTLVPGKGVLVDVFTKEGKYRDNFYLKLPQVPDVQALRAKQFTLFENCLFTFETDVDENPVVVKYQLIF